MHHLKAAGMLVTAVILIPFLWEGYDALASLVKDGNGAWLAPWSDYGGNARMLLGFLPFSGLTPFASILCALALAARYWLDLGYEEGWDI